MFFFEGCKCPVCGASFTANDDVVACPECGAPHHRECYKSNGGCAYADRHSEDFAWKRTDDSADETSGAEPGCVMCGVCGAPNPQGRLFCQGCGSDLHSSDYIPDDGERHYSGQQQGGDSGYYAFGGNVFRITDSDSINGVPVGDVKRYVGNMWYYYVPKFISMIRTGRRVCFNLSACILHGIWFISRKMYVLGGAILALMLGINAFQAYYTPTIMPLYEKYAAGDMGPMTQFVENNPLLAGAFAISTLVQYAVFILSGLFGNKIYMDRCVRDIKRINKNADNADAFNERLESSGGSAMIIALIAAALYFGLQYYINMRLAM